MGYPDRHRGVAVGSRLTHTRPDILRVQAGAAIVAQVGARTVHRPTRGLRNFAGLQLAAHGRAIVFIGNGP